MLLSIASVDSYGCDGGWREDELWLSYVRLRLERRPLLPPPPLPPTSLLLPEHNKSGETPAKHSGIAEHRKLCLLSVVALL